MDKHSQTGDCFWKRCPLLPAPLPLLASCQILCLAVLLPHWDSLLRLRVRDLDGSRAGVDGRSEWESIFGNS